MTGHPIENANIICMATPILLLPASCSTTPLQSPSYPWKCYQARDMDHMTAINLCNETLFGTVETRMMVSCFLFLLDNNIYWYFSHYSRQAKHLWSLNGENTAASLRVDIQSLQTDRQIYSSIHSVLSSLDLPDSQYSHSPMPASGLIEPL